MQKPVLVTGGAGFIGFSVIKRLLDDGQSVVAVDDLNDYYDVQLKKDRLQQLTNLPGFSFHQIDISEKDAMTAFWERQGGFTKVVHLAAQAGVRYSLTNPHAYIQSNCMGHLVVLDLCRNTKNFKHLVYASSSSVYGANTKVPFSVQDPVTAPVSLYAATKRSVELLSESYARLYQLPQTGLRFFTVYGPWGRPDMAPSIFADAILNDRPVPVFNSGKMKRDFTYIDDIVEGVCAALDTVPSGDVPHGLFNLGNTKSEDLMDFIAIIEKAAGKKANIEFKDMQKGDVTQTYADISESREQFGYNPKTSIEEGIPKFVQWYKNYHNL